MARIGIRESGIVSSMEVCFHVSGDVCTGVHTRAANSVERASRKGKEKGAGTEEQVERIHESDKVYVVQ